MLRNPCFERETLRQMWDNGATNQDGPGTVGAVLFRGLADWIGVD